MIIASVLNGTGTNAQNGIVKSMREKSITALMNEKQSKLNNAITS